MLVMFHIRKVKCEGKILLLSGGWEGHGVLEHLTRSIQQNIALELSAIQLQ